MSKIEQLEKQLSEIQSEIEQLKTDGGANTFSGPISVSHPEHDKGQEFEEGQWVVGEGNICGIYLFKFGENKGFFRDSGGNWIIELNKSIHVRYKKHTLRPATKDEISEALIADAKRRGLVEGAKCKRTWEPYGDSQPIVILSEDISSNEYKYYPEEDRLLCYGWEIYRDGDRAEILEPTKELITINGYGIEVDSQAIRIECGDTIGIDELVEFYGLVEKYDLTIHRGGEDITKQIHQISEKL